jgi:hypothetical protein
MIQPLKLTITADHPKKFEEGKKTDVTLGPSLEDVKIRHGTLFVVDWSLHIAHSAFQFY